MSKLKILSIAICCLVSALWTEIQGAEEYNEPQYIGYAFIKTANQFLIDPRGVLENPGIQTAKIESLHTALQEKDREINSLREQLGVAAREYQERLMEMEEARRFQIEMVELQAARDMDFRRQLDESQRNLEEIRVINAANLNNVIQKEKKKRVSIYAAFLARTSEIYLNNTGLGDSGAIDLSDALAGNTNTKLKLLCVGNDNHISDVGVIALAKVLQTNTTLTTLNLWGNFISDVGVIALAEALQTNITLTTLILTNNRIGTEGAKAIAQNRTIKTLKLGDNPIGIEGAIALAQNSTITTLYLSGSGGNPIGDTGAIALAANTTLTSLDLWGHNIGDEGKIALQNSCNHHLRNLRLDVIGNGTS